MKYTTKVKQAQFIGEIKIEPKGGDLTDANVKAILADKWGKELIRKGMLTIDGVDPSKIKDDTEGGK